MSAVPIRLFPDPILRSKAAPVKVFDHQILKLIQTLRVTMKDQRHGIGIAAPQIGISKQVALVDVSPRVPGAKEIILINPKILETRRKKSSREGCMSIPDYTGRIKRYNWAHVAWQDELGQHHQKVAEGIEAVCIQHEIDHLNGKLFIDRIVSLQRDLIKRSPS